VSTLHYERRQLADLRAETAQLRADLAASRAETARWRVACDIGADLRQQLWDNLTAATALLLDPEDWRLP
jgi:hypothetical protein